jgi:hypothetical protein
MRGNQGFLMKKLESSLKIPFVFLIFFILESYIEQAVRPPDGMRQCCFGQAA